MAAPLSTTGLGSAGSYLGHGDWALHAPSPESIEEAQPIRTRMLQGSERAERAEDRAERARLMTIVVVSGGPPGVAMASSLVEIADYALASWWRPVRAC